MNIFVVGSINMDLVIHTEKMPENGETISGSNFMTSPGGKGANQAVAASKLGGNVYMVGCVGNAFGVELLDSLTKYGVDTTFVRRVEEVSSGIAVITVIHGDNRIITDAGANHNISKEDINRCLIYAKPEDIIILQMEIKEEIVSYTLQQAKAKGLTTIFNPAPARDIDEALFSFCDYFIPNQSECQFYTGIYPRNSEEAIQCAKLLKEKGVKNVLITLGQDGSVFCGDQKQFSVKGYPKNPIDTTGAGDCYIGAFVESMAQQKTILEAMDYASAAASISVTRLGAQQAIPYAIDVERFLLEVK